MAYHFSLLTIFAEMFPGSLQYSLAGKALKDGLWSFDCFDLRDYSNNKHRNIDDTPAGGGAGLVMCPDVIGRSIDDALLQGSHRRLVYLTPRGAPLTQAKVRDFASKEGLTILCGRFEGVDERVLEAYNFEQICIGDYILSGGEPAALVLMDAIIRLLPGVTGKTESLDDESFETGLLEYPQYTRPQVWRGRKIPDILLSGHHGQIQQWRKAMAEQVTKERRPDLWQAYRQSNGG